MAWRKTPQGAIPDAEKRGKQRLRFWLVHPLTEALAEGTAHSRPSTDSLAPDVESTALNFLYARHRTPAASFWNYPKP